MIRARASECEAPLEFVTAEYRDSPVALSGPHQKQNAAVAIAALKAADISVTKQSIARGLADVRWPARFQLWNERTVIDGAHNPAGARVLAETWRDNFGEQRADIFLAVLRDKDVAGIVAALTPIAGRFVLVRARSERALPPAELTEIVGQVAPELPCELAQSFPHALSVRGSDAVLITGSLHFAGEALAHLRGEPDSLEDCLQ